MTTEDMAAHNMEWRSLLHTKQILDALYPHEVGTKEQFYPKRVTPWLIHRDVWHEAATHALSEDVAASSKRRLRSDQDFDFYLAYTVYTQERKRKTFQVYDVLSFLTGAEVGPKYQFRCVGWVLWGAVPRSVNHSRPLSAVSLKFVP